MFLRSIISLSFLFTFACAVIPERPVNRIISVDDPPGCVQDHFARVYYSSSRPKGRENVERWWNKITYSFNAALPGTGWTLRTLRPKESKLLPQLARCPCDYFVLMHGEQEWEVAAMIGIPVFPDFIPYHDLLKVKDWGQPYKRYSDGTVYPSDDVLGLFEGLYRLSPLYGESYQVGTLSTLLTDLTASINARAGKHGWYAEVSSPEEDALLLARDPYMGRGLHIKVTHGVHTWLLFLRVPIWSIIWPPQ